MHLLHVLNASAQLYTGPVYQGGLWWVSDILPLHIDPIFLEGKLCHSFHCYQWDKMYWIFCFLFAYVQGQSCPLNCSIRGPCDSYTTLCVIEDCDSKLFMETSQLMIIGKLCTGHYVQLIQELAGATELTLMGSSCLPEMHLFQHCKWVPFISFFNSNFFF